MGGNPRPQTLWLDLERAKKANDKLSPDLIVATQFKRKSGRSSSGVEQRIRNA